MQAPETMVSLLLLADKCWIARRHRRRAAEWILPAACRAKGSTGRVLGSPAARDVKPYHDETRDSFPRLQARPTSADAQGHAPQTACSFRCRRFVLSCTALHC